MNQECSYSNFVKLENYKPGVEHKLNAPNCSIKVYNPKLWCLDFEVRKKNFSVNAFQKSISLQGIAYPPKRKMSLTKDFIELTRDDNHVHVNILLLVTASSFAEPMLPSAPSHTQDSLTSCCSFLSLCWCPVSEHCGLCCKHHVITRVCVLKSSFAYFITILFFFKTEERNPRYKTSEGNWHHRYWGTNDTILNFKMKEGSWGPNSLASTFKGQQATVCRLWWFFKWSVNTSCV